MGPLDIEHNRQTLFIKVKNSFDGIVICADKDGETLPATRKSGGNHGHGLKNIARCIAKYDGHMDISHEGSIFSAAILLYVRG